MKKHRSQIFIQKNYRNQTQKMFPIDDPNVDTISLREEELP